MSGRRPADASRPSDVDLTLKTLNFATRIIASTLDRGQLPERSLDALCDFAMSKRAALLTWEEGSDVLQVACLLERGKRVPAPSELELDPSLRDVLGSKRPARFGLRDGSDVPRPDQDVGEEAEEGCLCLPLVDSRLEAVGVVTLHQESGKALPPHRVQALTALSTLVAVMMENARLFREATVDGLTGLRVRRYFEIRLEEEIARIQRHGGDGGKGLPPGRRGLQGNNLNPAAELIAPVFQDGTPGGDCPSPLAQTPTLAASSHGTTIEIKGSAPWVNVTGTLAEDGTVTATGRGTVAGFSDILAEFAGTWDAESKTLTGTYTLDSEKVISSGHPIVYNVEVSSGAAAGVSVLDNFYDPSSTTVDEGATVTWTWGGSNPHTVSFDHDTNVDSGTQSAGTFQHTFPSAGTFTYYCKVHGRSAMSGTVVVR